MLLATRYEQMSIMEAMRVLMWCQVLQRIYKYGGQPVARDILTTHYGRDFERAFGPKTGKAILHSTAGR